jgi:hypothetical protein
MGIGCGLTRTRTGSRSKKCDEVRKLTKINALFTKSGCATFEKGGKSIAVEYYLVYNGAEAGSEVLGGVKNIVNTRKCRENGDGG